MALVLMEYDAVIKGSDSVSYRARACGAETDDGRWQGWIEFLPPAGRKVLLSPPETLQLTRADVMHWASGLTAVYLEGALTRALDRLPLPTGIRPAEMPEDRERARKTPRAS